ncbi:DUF5133 domain-containing protein [Streptomyces sp. NPDC059740]|uniref:DUF5133 domain-containing protein n=1 Tax=Streptomyces sp. NPDC059740 TaxID=3346926 RepID=UPI00364A0042
MDKTPKETTVLMAHPAVLQDLLRRFHAAEREVLAGTADAAVEQRFRDLSHTLCVITGTGDVDAALLAAQYRLPGARTTDDSLLSAAPDTAPETARDTGLAAVLPAPRTAMTHPAATTPV